MERCCHGLVKSTCAGCATRSRPPVYLSGGGGTYHKQASCPAFLSGRRKAVRFGYENREVESVLLYAANLRDFVPCQACFGKAAFATRAG